LAGHKKHSKGHHGKKHGGNRVSTKPLANLEQRLEHYAHKNQLAEIQDKDARIVTAHLIGAHTNKLTAEWLKTFVPEAQP
jgi:hypothetical protein